MGRKQAGGNQIRIFEHDGWKRMNSYLTLPFFTVAAVVDGVGWSMVFLFG